MRETECPNTGLRCLYLKEHGKTINEQVLVVARSGHGKTITLEGFAEELHRLGYLVIFLTDTKGEFEFAFPMFEPTDKFHLSQLARDRRKPEAKKVEIYHPFSFNLPKEKKVPGMNIFTFPVEWVVREPLQFLLETEYDTTSIKIFLNALQTTKPGDSLHEILFRIEQDVKANLDKDGGDDKDKFTGFGTSVKSSGTMKEVKELYGIFAPFIKDFLIQPSDASINLDLRKMFRNQDAYHVLSTKWIKDPKMQAFVIFMWLHLIYEYRDLCHHPVCIVLDELPQYAPFNAKGYKGRMADLLRKIAIGRNKGEGGIFSLLGTQLWWDVDDRVNSKATEILLGRMTDLRDQEKVKKVIGSYIGDVVQSLKRGTYIRKGSAQKKLSVYRTLFPRHAHAEQADNFIKKFRREFPDKTIIFNPVIQEMKKVLKEHETRIKTLREQVQEKEQEKKAKKEKAKEEKKSVKSEVAENRASKAEQELRELKGGEISRRNERIVELKDVEGLGYGKILEIINNEFPAYELKSREGVGCVYRKMKKAENASVVVDENRPVAAGPLG